MDPLVLKDGVARSLRRGYFIPPPVTRCIYYDCGVVIFVEATGVSMSYPVSVGVIHSLLFGVVLVAVGLDSLLFHVGEVWYCLADLGHDFELRSPGCVPIMRILLVILMVP